MRKCPVCRGDSVVLNVRHAASGNRRRRECCKCRAKWTTIERDGGEELIQESVVNGEKDYHEVLNQLWIANASHPLQDVRGGRDGVALALRDKIK